jgi:hypothetical protein
MAGFFSGYRRVLLALVLLLPVLAVFTISSPALAAPAITVTPNSGAIGTSITIKGYNFDSYVGDYITITFGTYEVIGSPLEIPESGNFTHQMIIPEISGTGAKWISVYTTSAPVNLITRVSFNVDEPQMFLDKTQGIVGTEVNLTGQGYYSNRIVDVYYYDISPAKLGDTFASETGQFSLDFTIPHSTAGTHRIIAVNDKGNLLEAMFTVIPQITVNTDSAGPESLITLVGTGFGYRTDVAIHLGVRPVTTVRTSDKGDFEVVFNVPDMIPKTYEMKAQDTLLNKATILFTIAAITSISINSGSIGSEVIITGDGFSGGQEIMVRFDDIVVLSFTADVYGEFTESFEVPVVTGGNHEITITDGLYVKTYPFFVEVDSPQPPVLLLPADQTDTRALAYFDWQDVTDLSEPVTYRIQIADDRNFSSIIIDESGIPDSEYTLTVTQALTPAPPDLPYYWRVRAIDGAGNTGEWSASWSFNINIPMMPVVLLPEIDSTHGAPIYFDWQDASSLNPPVTYNFQIGTDLGFSSVVLERIGLTVSEYILTDDDKLPKTQPDIPYFWRIKAIDNAQNEGDWSTPQSFYYQSGFTFPSWAIYTLIGIAAVLVGYLAFWVGRRAASKPPDRK